MRDEVGLEKEGIKNETNGKKKRLRSRGTKRLRSRGTEYV